MTTNESKVLEIIWNWGGEASVDIVAREIGISINYARILCESLEREGCIDFLYSKLGKIKSKGKILVAEKRGQNLHPHTKGFGVPPPPKSWCGGVGARKIVVPEKPNKFGLGKDKRGKFILSYG